MAQKAPSENVLDSLRTHPNVMFSYIRQTPPTRIVDGVFVLSY